MEKFQSTNMPESSPPSSNFGEARKGIPTWLGLGIIIVIAVLVGGGIWTYQYIQNPISTATPAPIKTITYEDLANAVYDISAENLYFSIGISGPKISGYNPQAVKLTNGVFSVGPEDNVYPSGCTSKMTHSVSIAEGESGGPLYAIGDLNNDGRDDAVVMLDMTYTETDRSGPHDYCLLDNHKFSQLMLVVFLNKNGKAEQVDSYINGGLSPAFKLASDISGIKIKDGVINLFGVSSELFYKLADGKLVIANKAFTAPNLPVNLGDYANDDFGFIFSYPKDLNFQVLTPRAPVLFSVAWGTVSSRERFIVSVSSNDFHTCINDLDEPHDIPTELIINGITFYKIGGGDAAMGTYRNAMQYSTFHNNKCYQIYLDYFTHDCGRYMPLEPGNTYQINAHNDCMENNKAAQGMPDNLDIIASTFKFTK